LRRGSSADAQVACLREFLDYFKDVTEDRRKRPADDLASVIANARVGGELLSDMDAASYYTIILTKYQNG